jgi:hypothetical protein
VSEPAFFRYWQRLAAVGGAIGILGGLLTILDVAPKMIGPGFTYIATAIAIGSAVGVHFYVKSARPWNLTKLGPQFWYAYFAVLLLLLWYPRLVDWNNSRKAADEQHRLQDLSITESPHY